ncbi:MULTISPECIES: Hsp20/alpha crystallin family protein [Halolamina]|uniref:Molecular chaperone IbpA, HSP20 family n=1 Tax=Halolamina pelagica TaxID=699431 RepID=A0A1I5S9J5_9EURY|nr:MULTISPECIES: Hsp20/alpha crystallin family protein [Halolamina]NHX37164.1 Hsp20/alpha crystallin family protein [Halolamina sp. R1-12]SFP67369.1 Molecular chaperone IbpA, HSP20 family [Halolamina pelagica]
MTKLGDIGGSAVDAVMERVGRGVSRVQERKPLPYDLLESEDAYLVVFDAPGVEPSDVQVRFVDGEVQVRADRFRSFHEEFETRFPGRGLALSGRARLPPDAVVDADGADATLTENGTLEVRIPKEEDATDVPLDAEGEDESDSEEEADTGSEDAADAESEE